MLLINLVFILRKCANYSINLFSNQNMTSANLFACRPVVCQMRHLIAFLRTFCVCMWYDIMQNVCDIFNHDCCHQTFMFRSMSMRTLSMLGSRVSTPRYGTLNSHREFNSGIAAESRTLDRSCSNTIDRSRNGSGFERATSVEHSQPRFIDRPERTPPVTTSPLSFQTFYAQQQQIPVRNGAYRHVYPLSNNSPVSVGYVDMYQRGTLFALH